MKELGEHGNLTLHPHSAAGRLLLYDTQVFVYLTCARIPPDSSTTLLSFFDGDGDADICCKADATPDDDTDEDLLTGYIPDFILYIYPYG